MKAEEIYNKIKNEITKDIYNYDDQIVVISKWVESLLKNETQPFVEVNINDFRPTTKINIEKYSTKEIENNLNKPGSDLKSSYSDEIIELAKKIKQN